MKAHSESDYIPYVLKFMRKNHGEASFAELREYIEEVFPLNRQDKKPLPSLGCPRWHQRLRNLKSNKTMVWNLENVIEIPNGFAMQ